MNARPAAGHRALVVHGPYRGPSGYEHHVREFVRALVRQGVRVQLVDLPEWGPVKLPDALRDPWFDTLAAPVRARAVLHFCMPPQVRPRPRALNVNYTMFECTPIPERWLAHNLRHDLVVVPTQSSRAAWMAGGFPDDRLRICPLGVDPDRFRPGLELLDLPEVRGRPVSAYATRVLNVSELGPRKNLAALLRVWLAATTAADDAVLVLKLSRLLPGPLLTFLRDVDAAERAVGRTRAEAAPILFVDRLLADADMPRLFAVATHYWSMSHGEGWDQPMIEAAAAGLRLIAPAHTAYLAYLDARVARLVPARRVPVPAGPGIDAFFAGCEWWDPDEGAAADALREALAGTDAGRPGARGRVAADLTWERATARLLEIVREADERRRLRP
jgi:glycosyltransferase involved in cell wall biosynthesis